MNVCTPGANAVGHGLEFHQDDGSAGFFAELCNSTRGMNLTAQSGPVTGGEEWIIRAPGGVGIQSVHGIRSVRLAGLGLNPIITWSVNDDLFTFFEFFVTVSPPADDQFTWTAAGGTSSFFKGRLSCPSGTCNNGGTQQVFISNVTAKVLDQSPPAVTMSGALIAPGPVAGTKELKFLATDTGSGVAKVSLLVDGRVAESKTVANGGLCAIPYHAMAPCVGVLNSEFPTIDTTTLSEGTHTVGVVVEDASGRTTGTGSKTIDVHNRPTNEARPALSGTAKVSQSLAASRGLWDGAPTAFAFQWLRCPPTTTAGQEASCDLVAGAIKDSFAVTAADVGKRLIAKVSATNLFGTETAFSVPTETITAPSGGSGGGPGGGSGGSGGSVGPPQTRVLKHPRKKTALSMARFTFGSDQPNSSFQCKLDKGAFKPCASPFKRKVKPGRHNFKVRAVNTAGVADPTPPGFTWLVSKPRD